MRRGLATALAAAGAASVSFSLASIVQSPRPRTPPYALASSPPLRSLPLPTLLHTAILTDLARLSLSLRLPRALTAHLLRRKSALLSPPSPDRIILHLIPPAPSSALEIALRAHGPSVAAVILSPDALVTSAVLDRYGTALVSGMRLWRAYIASTAVPSRPPLPTDIVSPADWAALDGLMILLGRVCELASELRFDVILALPRMSDVASAVAVGHVATCLARAFADPRARAYPSILLSSHSDAALHGANILADQTFVQLSARLAPDEGRVEIGRAPAVLAVAGLQSVVAGAEGAALEYTRGIGDLQTARLRERVGGGVLVRREFVGREDDGLAGAAGTRLGRKVLREESRALWTRVRMIGRQAGYG